MPGKLRNRLIYDGFRSALSCYVGAEFRDRGFTNSKTGVDSRRRHGDLGVGGDGGP